MTTLDWLPKHPSWSEALRHSRALPVDQALPRLEELANYSLDFLETGKLDTVVSSFGEEGRSLLKRCPPVKLAMLGSSTLAHLAPAIRVAALRRGFAVEIYQGPYGMYRQELMDTSSALYRFDPDVLLLALDAHHLVSGDTASVERAMDWMQSCWAAARQHLRATVIQQTVMPVFQPVLGNNEHRYHNFSDNYTEDMDFRGNAKLAKLGMELGWEAVTAPKAIEWNAGDEFERARKASLK